MTVRTTPVQVEPHQASLHPDARAGAFVCLTVEDNGCGMNAETLDRVFEPFFTTKPIGKGTGMGMAVVYGIVKQHGGWISVRSQPGMGTTVHVFLPVSAKPVEAMTETASPTMRGGDETILIVEDDPAVLCMAVDVLNSSGYRVFQAASGAEAQKVFAANYAEISLLFTDLVMPSGMSGRQLAESLRAQKPELKVILTSGHNAPPGSGPDIAGAMFVAKPYSAAALIRAIRLSLDNGRRPVAAVDFLQQPSGATIAPAQHKASWPANTAT